MAWGVHSMGTVSTDLVIILSSDWVGSTATRAQLGEDQADTLQAYHDRLLRKIVEGEGRPIVKNPGDGGLGIFHSAGQALSGAAGIQEQFTAYSEAPGAIAPMHIRVGLSAGDVVHREGDIFGTGGVEGGGGQGGGG